MRRVITIWVTVMVLFLGLVGPAAPQERDLGDWTVGEWRNESTPGRPWTDLERNSETRHFSNITFAQGMIIGAGRFFSCKKAIVVGELAAHLEYGANPADTLGMALIKYLRSRNCNVK